MKCTPVYGRLPLMQSSSHAAWCSGRRAPIQRRARSCHSPGSSSAARAAVKRQASSYASSTNSTAAAAASVQAANDTSTAHAAINPSAIPVAMRYARHISFFASGGLAKLREWRWGGRRFGSIRQTPYASAPPDRSAVLCCKLASSASPPPLLRMRRKSERCIATRLIEPAASTSTTFQPAAVCCIT